MKSDVLAKIREIKIFLFDLEGVLIDENISEVKSIEIIANACKEFNQLGLLFGIVTAHENDKLIKDLKAINGCIVLSSSLDKVTVTDNFLVSRSIDYKNVFYMGDDLFDIQLLKKCGVSCAPKNARREVKRIVSFIAKSDKCKDLLNEIISYYKKTKEAVNRVTKY